MKVHPTIPLGCYLLVTITHTLSAAPGDLDLGFNPNVNGTVRCTAVQPDGKILLGGNFTTVGGIAHTNIARLNQDGSIDTNFNANTTDSGNLVNSIAVQMDGKILLAGIFTKVDGVTRNNMARLNANGTLDPGFNPNVNGFVECVIVQADGNIIIGGGFQITVNGIQHANTARLYANGILDTNFVSIGGGAISVYSMALQTNGKIVVGGDFSDKLVRLNSDGTLDLGFTNRPNNPDIYCIAVQVDGKIIIGGGFLAVGGVTRQRIARLNSDSTLDMSFNPNVANDIYSIAVQTDGKIIIGGEFITVDGVACHHIARVNADGSVDTGFNSNVSNTSPQSVISVGLQADGKILVGGDFVTFAATNRNHIARLENESATQSLTVTSGNRVEWLRGGSSPEAERVTVEFSGDEGNTWTLLGSGSRISGGWELTGLSLPTSGQIRARATVVDSLHSGSSGLVETMAEFPIRPILKAQSGTGSFTILWETNFTGYTAQSTPTLADSNSWVDLTSVPAVSGSNYFLTFPATNAAQFFRLRLP